MVGVLIRMRAAVLRGQSRGKRGIGGLVLAVIALAMAIGTFAGGAFHYDHPGVGADVMASFTLGWLLGWTIGPLIVGDDSTLRMDYFKLLPIPARRLAYALLGAAFADPALVFSAVAFSGLIAYGAHSGTAPTLVGVAAVVLNLVLAVVASTVAMALVGPVVSSRRGRDFTSFLLAIGITLASVASGLVPVVAKKLSAGHTPALSALVRALPSGWGAEAVDAARRGQWGMTALALAGVAVLIGVLVAVWPALLARRLTMPPAARGGRRGALAGHKGRPILPDTPVGAALGKELRLYSRQVLRSLLLLISFLVGVLVCVLPTLNGDKRLLPFAGVLFTVIAAACFTNQFGDDGSAFWLVLTVPGAARAEIRARILAWLLVVAPLGLVLGLVLTALSGQGWAWPWMLAGQIGMTVGAFGLMLWISARNPLALDTDGGPTPTRVLSVHVALIVLPVAALWPAAALLIPGALGHLTWLGWLAVPVEAAYSWLLLRGLAASTLRRVQHKGPEIFGRVAGHQSA